MIYNTMVNNRNMNKVVMLNIGMNSNKYWQGS